LGKIKIVHPHKHSISYTATIIARWHWCTLLASNSVKRSKNLRSSPLLREAGCTYTAAIASELQILNPSIQLKYCTYQMVVL